MSLLRYLRHVARTMIQRLTENDLKEKTWPFGLHLPYHLPLGRIPQKEVEDEEEATEDGYEMVEETEPRALPPP